jgi:hypothetical protein
VESVVVNGGEAQRSRINSITVTFNMLVTLDPRAIVIIRGDWLMPKQEWQVSEVNGKTQVVITFSGAGTEAGSLRDGRWFVKVVPGRVHRADHAANLMPGMHITKIHRLYGDADGDRSVTDADQTAFNTAMGQTDALSLSTFDFDGDGDVDAADQLAFGKRFGRRI